MRHVARLEVTNLIHCLEDARCSLLTYSRLEKRVATVLECRVVADMLLWRL